MAKQIKNAKAIQTKSRTHDVVALGHGAYEVTSGASGKSYRVLVKADGDDLRSGGATCTCNWGKYRPRRTGGESACSHVIAAMNWQAEQDGRRLSAWTDEDRARRQHRPMTDIGDGVVITSRKVA